MKNDFDLMNLYKDEFLSLNDNILFFIEELNSITELSHTSINKENLLDYFNATRLLNRNDVRFHKAGICLSVLIGEYCRKEDNGSFILIRRVSYSKHIPYYTISIIYDDKIYFVQEDFMGYYHGLNFLEPFFNYREKGHKSFEQNYYLYQKYNSNDIKFIK